MKLPRLITRRRAWHVGLAASLLLAGVYFASGKYSVTTHWDNPYTQIQLVDINISAGRIQVDIGKNFPPTWLTADPFPPVQFRVRRGYSLSHWFRFELSHPSVPLSIDLYTAWIPLWLPLLLIAAPTAYLWRTDRRAKPWQCAKCRYDLRGLEGGLCPECGESIESS